MKPVIVPLSLSKSQTKAKYVLLIDLSENWDDKLVSAISFLAITIRPVVFLSNLCTRPGLSLFKSPLYP